MESIRIGPVGNGGDYSAGMEDSTQRNVGPTPDRNAAAQGVPRVKGGDQPCEQGEPRRRQAGYSRDLFS